MINPKSDSELQAIIAQFDAPALTLVEKIDAGPDEELYLFEDSEQNRYGLWSRDYMSELEFEANGLKNSLNIEVKAWIKLKDSDEYVTELDGDSYALFIA